MEYLLLKPVHVATVVLTFVLFVMLDAARAATSAGPLGASRAACHRHRAARERRGPGAHRIALSDARLLAPDEGRVRLAYKDYHDGNRNKVLALSGEEFIGRFLLHVP